MKSKNISTDSKKMSPEQGDTIKRIVETIIDIIVVITRGKPMGKGKQ